MPLITCYIKLGLSRKRDTCFAMCIKVRRFSQLPSRKWNSTGTPWACQELAFFLSLLFADAGLHLLRLLLAWRINYLEVKGSRSRKPHYTVKLVQPRYPNGASSRKKIEVFFWSPQALPSTLSKVNWNGLGRSLNKWNPHLPYKSLTFPPQLWSWFSPSSSRWTQNKIKGPCVLPSDHVAVPGTLLTTEFSWAAYKWYQVPSSVLLSCD